MVLYVQALPNSLWTFTIILIIIFNIIIISVGIHILPYFFRLVKYTVSYLQKGTVLYTVGKI